MIRKTEGFGFILSYANFPRDCQATTYDVRSNYKHLKAQEQTRMSRAAQNGASAAGSQLVEDGGKQLCKQWHP